MTLNNIYKSFENLYSLNKQSIKAIMFIIFFTSIILYLYFNINKDHYSSIIDFNTSKINDYNQDMHMHMLIVPPYSEDSFLYNQGDYQQFMYKNKTTDYPNNTWDHSIIDQSQHPQDVHNPKPFYLF